VRFANVVSRIYVHFFALGGSRALEHENGGVEVGLIVANLFIPCCVQGCEN
jgi:hypothetical protein